MACSFASYLLVLLVDAHLVTGILILLESVRRHLVKADGGLVGVLDQDVLAVVFRMTMSTKVRTMAQPLLRLRFIWLANSRGL